MRSKAVEAFLDGNDTSIKDRSLLLSRYVWRLVHSPLSTLQIISVDEADNKSVSTLPCGGDISEPDVDLTI